MQYELTYENRQEEEKTITIDIDYSTYYDGIGPYEYWGSKEYDKGYLCAEVNRITYDKTNLTKEEIEDIDLAIDKQASEIEEACLKDKEDSKEYYLERE
jgi:hypothetical protein